MSAPIPSSVTVYFSDPDVEPSTFPRALARPDGAFLVITDLTSNPQKTVILPEHAIDCAVLLELA